MRVAPKKLSFALFLTTAIAGWARGETAQLVFPAEPLPEALKEVLQERLPDEASAANSFDARRQARRAGNIVQDTLNAEGYYAPKIETGVAAGPPFKALVRVDPGKKFSIGTLEIAFDGEPPLAAHVEALEAGLPLKGGDDAIPGDILAAERWIVDQLRGFGYAFATAEERTALGDRERATLDVEFKIAAGARIVFGDVDYPTGIDTKPSYLKRLVPFEAGDVYDPAQLATLNGRLSATRLFRIATARLSDDVVGLAPGGEEIRNVELTLVERAQNTVTVGAEFSTADGYGVSTEIIRRNMARRGDVLTAGLSVAELASGLTLQWRRPNEFGYGRGLVLDAEIEDEKTDAYDRTGINANVGFEVVRGPDFSYTYGVAAAAAREETTTVRRDIQTLGTYASARLDRADNVLDPRRGWRAEARIEPTYAFGQGSGAYVRGIGQVRGYVPLDEDRLRVLAARVRLGTVAGAGRSDLPIESRFYAGGGGSVRGYAYQAIGDRSDVNEPLGGKSLMEVSVEARWTVRPKIGVVAFVDGGATSSRVYPAFEDMRYGAGLGVRYATPAGPIRLDVAVPIDRTEFDDPFQLYVSIGQAF
jgi:translocation and assembly module TamA